MVTKKPLFFWVFQRYRGLQLLLLAVIGVTVFFRVVPLELQKRIVNRAISLKKMDLLLVYCGFYLGAVVLAGGLKYLINVLQGYLGEKLLYEIRTELYQHVLRLPLPLLETDLKGKHTVVAVVHRLDTVAAYDRIAVLKAGRIVEMGQYDHLMAAQNVFYQLKHGTASGVSVNG